MVVDPTLARSFARKNLQEWVDSGAAFASALKNLLSRAHVEVQQGRPPAKVVKKAREELTRLLRNSKLPGAISEDVGRRHEFKICLAEPCGNGVAFVLVAATINGRTGSISVATRRVFTASQHVLQRLHQRMSTGESQTVLCELFSCLTSAGPMRAAARAAGAMQWPLLTANGLLVCAPDEDVDSSVLITWIQRDDLGKKWRGVASDLQAASSAGALLADQEFCVELLRLHSWLLRPHNPGPDIAALWWASRDADDESGGAAEIDDLLTQDGVDTVRDTVGSTGRTPSRESPEVEEDLPLPQGIGSEGCPVLVRDRILGIVVQVWSNGNRVVALKEGFFGTLRPHTPLGEALELDPHQGGMQLGERVLVEVTRIAGKGYTGPQSILLARADVADADWALVEQRYPLGSIVVGSLVWRIIGRSMIAFGDGVTAFLVDRELSWSNDHSIRDSLVLGQQVRVRVIGTKADERQLIISLREVDGHPLEKLDDTSLAGKALNGVVTNIKDYGVFVGLPIGCDGLLHGSEIPEGVALATGDQISVRVISVDKERRRISLAYCTC